MWGSREQGTELPDPPSHSTPCRCVCLKPPTHTHTQQDVTSYIQCRGRARKRGSRYCFMQAQDLPHSIQHIIM